MLSIEEKVGQMMAVGFDGLTAPDYLLDWVSAGRVGTVILFARNIESPAQVAALTQSLHDAAKLPLLISIDQEGGTVARLRDGFSESPGALALSSIREGREVATRQVFNVLGAEMASLGINWAYAPVVDLIYNADNPTVGTRSFGTDPHHVGRMASEAVIGLQERGVAACAKHFPGLGDTAIDTHLALPRLNTPLEHLLEVDLLPYRAVIRTEIASIMTTHTIFTTLDAEHPATLSEVIVRRLLREELRFDGVVSSDCMEMKAIDDYYGVDESARRAVLAGIDVILFSHTPEKQSRAYDALLQAVKSGDIPEVLINQANARIQTFKARFPVSIIDPAQVNTIAAYDVTHQAALNAITDAHANFMPIQPHQRVVLVEFVARVDSLVQEQTHGSQLGALLCERLPNARTLILPPRPTDDEIHAINLQDADVLILATRNAHLNPAQSAALTALSASVPHVVLLALRNPYDAVLLPQVQVLCTCGDSLPSLRGVVQVIMGDYPASGTLPVEVVS